MKEYYKTLGVNEDAKPSDIKKAYKKLAQNHHPDKCNGESEEYLKILEAYTVLKNEKRRKHYDETGEKEYTNIRQHALNYLVRTFKEWLQNYFNEPNRNMVADTRSVIQRKINVNDNAKEQIDARIQGTKQHGKKIKTNNNAENLFSSVLNEEIKNLNSDLQNINQEKEILNMVIEMLNDYEFTGEIYLSMSTPSAGASVWASYL